ncbi:hypothetical protein UFOVP464_34 [uncultured Caudovirales phage]|uniref:Uncharacterized protein n=1 Tax=uncultured Caudovirales phage TaxID=2100421 RepID=A0A6J5MLE3_9CAUD|nr:hypothetical protein UFOVP464_34 [uncultured Caudovirales phage]CAB4189211.1 hypothetical protein UFOVP1189_10 [uncultured Caudovirales phage]
MNTRIEDGKIVIQHGIETVRLVPTAAHRFALDILAAVNLCELGDYVPTASTPKNWAPDKGTGVERL